MPSRIFTYNPNSPLPGYNQIEDLVIGEIGQNPSSLAPYKWFMGPSETDRYIFAKAVPSRNVSTPDGLNDGNVTFYASSLNDEDFFRTSRYIRFLETGLDQSFDSAISAVNWLNENGYWVNRSAVNWTPAQISTDFWYDADDISTFTLSGTLISQWNDKSGNGRNMLQLSVAAQPVYSANTLNGKAIVDFTAQNRFLTAASPTITDASYYLVAKAISPVLGQGVVSFNSSSNRNSGIVFQENFGLQPFISPKPSWTPWGITSFIDFSGGSRVGTYNGEVRALQPYIGGNFFSPLGLGYRQVGNIFMDCQIAEIVITTTASDVATRQKMEGYLAWKWGLQSNLPIAHPYKDNAPTI